MRRATMPSPLARAPSEPAVRYEYQGRTFTLDDYLARNPATGLLVARDDTILIERYQYARHDRHRFMSWSMAKTVTAMLIGIAIADGRIRSVEDLAAVYVPALAGTEYGRTSLRHLLQMSSGVLFVEEYTGKDDVARLSNDTFRQIGSGGVEAVTQFNVRAAPPGTKFYYASVETQVLGLVLRSAVGRPVADYLHEKIWEPIGAEADATWLIDRSGQEAAYCCINAVLRDYARLGTIARARWELARAANHSRRVDQGGDDCAPRPAAAHCRRLRLSGLDIGGRAADVRAPWHTRSSDLRRSGQPARHGPHGGSKRGPRSWRPGGERTLAEPRTTARQLIADQALSKML